MMNLVKIVEFWECLAGSVSKTHDSQSWVREFEPNIEYRDYFKKRIVKL